MNLLTLLGYLATSCVLLHSDVTYIPDTSVFPEKETSFKEKRLFQDNILVLWKDFDFAASKCIRNIWRD